MGMIDPCACALGMTLDALIAIPDGGEAQRQKITRTASR